MLGNDHMHFPDDPVHACACGGVAVASSRRGECRECETKALRTIEVVAGNLRRAHAKLDAMTPLQVARFLGEAP